MWLPSDTRRGALFVPAPSLFCPVSSHRLLAALRAVDRMALAGTRTELDSDNLGAHHGRRVGSAWAVHSVRVLPPYLPTSIPPRPAGRCRNDTSPKYAPRTPAALWRIVGQARHW
jgi:hypothetical protein